MTTRDEHQLIRRARRGDRQALDSLLRAQLPGIRRVLVRCVGSGPDLDDATQLVLIEVAKSIARFRGDAALSTWIHRIAVRVASNLVRQRSNVITLPLPPALVDGRSGVRAVENRHAMRVVETVLDGLGSDKRTAFVLHDVEGHTTAEIAVLLSIPEGTVSWRLREARLAVRSALRNRSRRVG